MIAGDIFDKHARAYQEKFMSLRIYDAWYERLLHYLHADDRVLDIACGPGVVSAYLVNKIAGLQVEGVDASANMITLAKSNIPEGTFMVKDCRDLSDLHGPYDGIICAFCIPYLNPSESAALFCTVASLLRREGVFFLSFIDDNPSCSTWKSASNGVDKTYIHYYDLTTLQPMLELAGFSIMQSDSLVYNLADNSHETHSVLFLRRG